MSQIIKDSYYLIGLYQEKFKEINGAKLTNLLYLLEGYYMAYYEKDSLSKEEFKVDMLRTKC